MNAAWKILIDIDVCLILEKEEGNFKSIFINTILEMYFFASFPF